jgi:hypothetical protein
MASKQNGGYKTCSVTFSLTVPSSLWNHPTNHLANFSDTLCNTSNMNNFPPNAILDIPQALTHNYAQHFTFYPQSTLWVRDQIRYDI